jgi:eukaryotic-like serine/threonine-protein kinase
LIGKTFGQYVIEHPLGEGGMGVVYRARDTRLDRTVAIKVVSGLPATDLAARDHLLREARAASGVNHPGVCTIHQVEQIGDETFLVMEYVEGRPLSELIPDRGLPIDTALRYAIQIADALAHAHGRGVVHRDLKSLNLMVTPEDRIKILDFGLAKRSSPGAVAEMTRSITGSSGVVAGTLAYMAPEVLRGEAGDAGADVWALGIVLFEMVSGVRPFDGPTGFALTAAIMHEPPTPLPEKIPGAVGAVIARCLARDRTERYRDASQVRAALESLSTPSSSVLVAPLVSRPRRRGLLAGLAAVIVVAGLALVAWFATPSRSSGTDAIDSVAVLPFANDTQDPDAEFLSDGLSEHLLNNLSRVSNLRVISQSAVLRHKNSAAPPQDIGRALGVGALVTGRLTRSADRLAVSVELIGVRDGSRLWGDRYDRPMAEVVAVQQDIAREVAGRLRPRLTGDEQAQVAKRATENPKAFELYLKGRYHTAKYTEEGFQKGLEFFRQAIEIDPTFALAYEGLAYNYGSSGEWTLAPRDAFPRARAAAERALELDPGLADAHSAAGLARLYIEWDWAGAEQHFQRAIELNPGSVFAHTNYAHLLLMTKRMREGVAAARRAQELDPLSMEANTYLGAFLVFAGEYDTAYQQLQRTLDIDKNFWFARMWVGRTAEELGRADEARREIEQANSQAGVIPEPLAHLGKLKAASGDRQGATQVLEELASRSRKGYVSPYFSAIIQAALGDRDAAFASLERGFEARTVFMTWLLFDPDMDPLRNDPRFAALVKRVGLP